MPTQPIRATPGQGGGWIRDSSGMMAPVGSSLSLKEFIQLPKEMRDITMAANTLVRGNFSAELWPDLAMLNAIAPRHRLTQVFIASVTAGSMAQNGQATANFLQGSVGMIAPSAMSTYLASPEARHARQAAHKKHDGKANDEDNE